jgi:hypothetical protein
MTVGTTWIKLKHISILKDVDEIHNMDESKIWLTTLNLCLSSFPNEI